MAKKPCLVQFWPQRVSVGAACQWPRESEMKGKGVGTRLLPIVLVKKALNA